MHKDYLESIIYQDFLTLLGESEETIINILKEGRDPVDIYRAQGASELIEVVKNIHLSILEELTYNLEKEEGETNG